MDAIYLTEEEIERIYKLNISKLMDEHNSVSAYESLYNYKELHGFASSRGMSAVDARWADDIIVVTMDEGSIRRYSDWNRYDTIR